MRLREDLSEAVMASDDFSAGEPEFKAGRGVLELEIEDNITGVAVGEGGSVVVVFAEAALAGVGGGDDGFDGTGGGFEAFGDDEALGFWRGGLALGLFL